MPDVYNTIIIAPLTQTMQNYRKETAQYVRAGTSDS